MKKLDGFEQAKAVEDLRVSKSLPVDDYRPVEGGACEGEDVNTFYIEGDSRLKSNVEKVEAARAICNRCNVIDACLKSAFVYSKGEGIWGGFTEKERTKLMNRRRAS